MQARGHRQQRSTRRLPRPATLSLRQAIEMAAFELAREAAIYEMAPTGRAQERASELHARGNELRRMRERLR